MGIVSAPTIKEEREEAVPNSFQVKPFADFPNTPYINYLGIKKPGC